ncbi:MAG: HAD family hydrolase [Dongiaceae bacterium]
MTQFRKDVLVCDLDNTLYDWVAYFVPSFYAMADKAAEIMGCDREKLLDDFRLVHQRHHDSEHPFALFETRTVRESFRGQPFHEVVRALDPALHAFNSSRKRLLELHPGVSSTLQTLRASGVVLIAHTESRLYGVVDRLRRFNLTEYFSRIYCRQRATSKHPNELVDNNWLADFPMHRVVELSHHQMKPDPDVLREICSREGFSVDHAAYVGDSIARDVLMAKRARVFAIWAAYGAHHNEQQYAALVRITHWTSTDVEREKRLRKEAESISPDYVARSSFSEVIDALQNESLRTSRRTIHL